jgi:hypothetical protein
LRGTNDEVIGDLSGTKSVLSLVSYEEDGVDLVGEAHVAGCDYV